MIVQPQTITAHLSFMLALPSCQRSLPGAEPLQSASDTGADSSTLEPAGPVVDGWVEYDTDAGVRCEHPRIEANCNAGWCTSPAGCFIIGSPETELGCGMNTELLTAVLFDTPGNVDEWVNDRTTYRDLPVPSRTQQWRSFSTRKSRISGSYGDAGGLRPWLRAAARNYSGLESVSAGTGFRLVRTEGKRG